MRKRIFLLGGTGYIGLALTRQLLANRTAYDVTMLVHRRAPFRELEQANTYSGSLTSFDLSILDRSRPDTMIHMARMSGEGRVGRFWAALKGARANRRIIQHLQRNKLVPKTIYVSGSLVYGDCGETAVDEMNPIRPTAFAREYIKAEQPWMTELQRGELPVSILRPPWIIGRGSWFASFYLNSIRRHGMVPLFGDGRNLMSFLDVEDCAGLVAHAAVQAQAGRCYNLFTPGAFLTQQEFVERLAGHTGTVVRRFSASEVKGKYGQAVLEAFTFSNKYSTKYPEFLANYDFRHPSIDDMIRNNVPAELCR